MATVQDILAFVETLAPRNMKMDWDNVGLLCGSRATEVTKVLVALDPFEHVCKEAADMGAQLIVTHHPMIFQALKAVTDETSIGRGIMLLCRHGISAVNAHTNLDCAPGGVNDTLAAALGLEEIAVVNPSGVDADGREWGLLRSGYTDETTLPEFLAHVKQALGCEGLRYVDGGKPVRKVAVGGGACGEFFACAAAQGCDTFVTSDIKYNQFLDAKALGLNLIDAGHFPTEDPVCEAMIRYLSERFPQLTIQKSISHKEIIQYC